MVKTTPDLSPYLYTSKKLTWYDDGMAFQFILEAKEPLPYDAEIGLAVENTSQAMDGTPHAILSVYYWCSYQNSAGINDGRRLIREQINSIMSKEHSVLGETIGQVLF